MRDDLSAEDALIEHALDCHRLAFDDVGVLAARSEIDQSAAAAVLDNEHVAEDFGDVAAHGGWAAGLQPVYRSRLQQQDAARLPILGDANAASTGSRTCEKHGKCGSGQQAAMPDLPAFGRRRGGVTLCIAFGHWRLLSSIAMPGA
ncbi:MULTISPECIES: hypothetical protein [Bradyrhizobium]|uniref:hypothetical protein n=1 Tax=Bradyrhizobium elkanii TaxID=29448 RepID=UPI0027149F77|nr:hypothetical protein [Bradyrhizobium elkanii]WLA49712.1 hypothetical protein QIH80_05815 [Bradyrhizobium elkanii]WLB80055.1 hypothetical protein QIH83_38170 [Bradyrhizobium elkanii]